MAVLPHEGKYNILYGTFGFPVGSAIRPGYLARPDAVGRFPVVLVLPDIRGLESFEKDLCRHLARNGFAALALDPYRGARPGRDATLDEAVAAYNEVPDRRALADVDELCEFVASPDSGWAADGPVGLLGLDVGGRYALLYASTRNRVGSAVAVAAPLAGDDDRQYQVGDAIERITVPVLGLYGRDDELVPAESVDVAQSLNTSGTWILYEGTGHDFMDPDTEGFHAGAAADARARLVRFFAATLPAAAPEAY